MNIILIFFLCYFFFVSQPILNLGSNPLGAVDVELILHSEYKGGSEGFYSNVRGSISENGTVVLYDRGNKRIHVYKNGKEINSFGKEGNGPFELSSGDRIYAFNDIIVVGKNFKIHIFDYAGKKIKSIKHLHSMYDIYKITNGFRIQHVVWPNNNNGLVPLYEEYNNSGDLLKKVDSSISPSYSMNHNTWWTYPFKQYHFAYQKGEYSILVYDHLYKPIYKINRPFKSIKPKAKKPKILKNKSRMLVLEHSNQPNDIISILGSVGNYLFVQTASEDDRTILIDIIDDSFRWLGVFKKTFDSEITFARIENNKLILCLNNKNDGPFLSMYELKVRKKQ